MPSKEDTERLRAELDGWRRRAEVAEAVAAERLARAETAERALRAAESALSQHAAGSVTPPATEPDAPAAKRPASLRERWRRYTETLN